MVGRGFPNSFYAVYVRARDSGKWWRFEEHATPSCNPIIEQRRVPVKNRTVVVWGQLACLLAYKHMRRGALDALFDRVGHLLDQERDQGVRDKSKA